jgi:hypothetical protein
MHWLSLKELLSWNPLHIKEKQFGSAKIRFDNAFRFWISTSSVLVLFGLNPGSVMRWTCRTCTSSLSSPGGLSGGCFEIW